MSDKELRERDAWIAEHVMGWKRNRYLQPMPKDGEFFWSFGGESALGKPAEVVCGFGIVIEGRCVFHPTTNRADAFAVLQKCMAKSGHVEVHYLAADNPLISGKNCKQFCVAAVGFVADADTLELAICEFAYKLFSQVNKRDTETPNAPTP